MHSVPQYTYNAHPANELLAGSHALKGLSGREGARALAVKDAVTAVAVDSRQIRSMRVTVTMSTK